MYAESYREQGSKGLQIINHICISSQRQQTADIDEIKAWAQVLHTWFRGFVEGM